MTYKELCEDVLSLGFETDFDSPERVLFATNRALMIICTERPLYASAVISKPTVTAKEKIADFSHKGGNVDSFDYEARAFCFKTCGIGKYRIIEGENEKIFEFSQNLEIHRGFLHGNGKIEFLGEYSYSVYDFYLFDEILSDRTEDIPAFSGYTEYDLRDHAKNFLSIINPPTDKNGIAIANSNVRGEILRVPDSYSGKIVITYKKAPQRLSGDPDEDILLPCGCEHLLALLTASYIWLDDDADKASYYMGLYREAMAAVKFYDRTTVENSYHVTNGWA
ncbi:MAG: hypothetical protein E7612_04540 [Ruminococcaceae bacterium]|nr:hypothetical protein [Oscillospiraceae bacterium]